MKRSGPPQRKKPLKSASRPKPRPNPLPPRQATAKVSASPAPRSPRGQRPGRPRDKLPKRVAPAGEIRGAREEAGRAEWKKPRRGRCAACRVRGPLVLHHIVVESKVRRYGGDPWDQVNGLPVGAPAFMGGRCNCHDGHHHPGSRDTRFSMTLVSDRAVGFAVDVLGAGRALDYFTRRYRNAAEDPRLAALHTPTNQ